MEKIHEEREYLLANEKVTTLFRKFSIPAVVGMMVQAIYVIVDRYFIGNMKDIGSVAIGGIGVVIPITFIFLAFSMLFGIGAGANISIKMGEGKKKTAEKILGTAVVMLIISSILIAIIFFLKMDYILYMFGATKENIGYAKEFLNIILIGNVWNCLAFAFNNTIRAEGNPKYAMISMLLGAVTNCILDPIFIFTLDMGVKGAAYATIIAQFLSFIWTLRYYLGKNSLVKLRFENLRVEKELLKLITAIGISPFSMQIAGAVIGALFNNNLKVYGGSLAQGAYAIINSVSTLFYMPIFGMNQGLQPIIGYNYGAKKYKRVREAFKVGVIAATCVCAFGWLICQIIPHVIVPTMAKDPKLIEITTYGLRIFEALMIIVGFQIISTNFFQSIGKAKISFFLSLCRQVIVLIPLLVILPKFFGLLGIWVAMPISDLICNLLTIAFVIREFKVLKRQEEEYNKVSEKTS